MKSKLIYSIGFAVIIIASNYLVQFQISDWFTMGAILFPIGFLFTDILNEKKGEAFTKSVVNVGILLAVSPTILIADYRIAVASIFAYYISQNIDILIFSFLKKKFINLWWLRNNASTIVSQTVDSFLFFFIAFYNVMPTNTLITLSLGALSLKFIMSVLDTPIFYYFGIRK